MHNISDSRWGERRSASARSRFYGIAGRLLLLTNLLVLPVCCIAHVLNLTHNMFPVRTISTPACSGTPIFSRVDAQTYGSHSS